MNKSIITIISLFLVLLFAIFYFWPRYHELRNLEKEIEIKVAEVSRREERVQELREMDKELKNYQEQLAKIDSALPFDTDLPALFDFLQKAGSESGLVLKSVSHSVPRSAPDFTELKETEASLIFSGAYTSLKEFLPFMETTARLIETQAVSFSRAPEEGSREFKLRIKVYSY